MSRTSSPRDSKRFKDLTRESLNRFESLGDASGAAVPNRGRPARQARRNASTSPARAKPPRPGTAALRDRRKTAHLVPALLTWFARNARDLPWRRTLDPYAIWVSEIMLQQTQVKTVIPYWQRWMRQWPTVQALALTKPDQVLKLWEGLGYYARARNLQTAARQILRTHGGEFPVAFD